MTPTDGNLTYNVAGAYATARACYDPEADALDIELVPHWQGPGGVVAFTRGLAPGILADFDGSGHIISIEILGLTSSPGLKPGDSYLSAFPPLEGGRHQGAIERSCCSPGGDCHGSRLPRRSAYTFVRVQRHAPTPSFRGGKAPVATSGIDFTHRPSRWNPPNLWSLLRCCLKVPQEVCRVNGARLSPALKGGACAAHKVTKLPQSWASAHTEGDVDES